MREREGKDERLNEEEEVGGVGCLPLSLSCC